jgi:DNA sulfur modification protein DndD
MKLRLLTLENWGPYVGTQELDFSTSEAAPVVLIHGENMRGKTSIMRALRWALYGSPAMTTETNPPEIKEFANWDVIESGDEFSFGATLQFEHAGLVYEISRLLKARQANAASHTITANVESILMREIGGNPIPAEQIETKIRAILDPKVADFFLFDGELLDRFEETLRSAEAQGFVRKQIEVTLGVPALLNLRRDLDDLSNKARLVAKNKAKATQENEKWLKILAETEDEIASNEKDIKDATLAKNETQGRISQIREQLDTVKEIRDALIERNRSEKERDRFLQDRIGLKAELKSIMHEAWWLPLAEILPRKFDETLQKLSEIRALDDKQAILTAQLFQLKHQLSSDHCDMCKQALPESSLNEIRRQIAETESALAEIADRPESSGIDEELVKLRPFSGGVELRTRVLGKLQNIDLINLRLHGLEQEIQNLSDHIGSPEYDAVELEDSLQEQLFRDKLLDDSIKRVKQKLDENKARQRTALDKSTSDSEGARRPRAELDVYDRLSRYLDAAVEEFRTSMRREVQDSATKIFRQLTSEEEYDGLRIDGNYYLKIVDHNDRIVKRRSAGASEIVTISLIGALGECSVEQAPIVMDTPFGRLDNQHRANILEWLASRSSQSVLFVQSGEFERDRDLVHLKNRVGREYRLRRIGNASTQIEVLQ